MYPAYLDKIDWEVIDLRYIRSNIKNMYFQPGPLPLSFRTFNSTDTKTPKGLSKKEHSEQPSIKKARKNKGSKVQNESTLSEWKLRDTKELIDLSGQKVQNQSKHSCLIWEMRGFCFIDCLHKAYHMNSHTQNQKTAIIKHIAKLR